MSQIKILVVDDEDPIREMIAMALEGQGYNVLEAADGRAAHNLCIDQRPDLILLDWMMPGLDGIELARRLQRDDHTREIPIIMLTAKAEEDSRVKGLETGVDDYITKPFSVRELIARVKAVLRRTHAGSAEKAIEAFGLRLDPVSQRVSIEGKAISLGPTEYRLLEFFMTHQDRAYTRANLLDQVWGGNVYIEDRTVDVHIRRLRKVLEASGHDRLVQTVRGTGYRFSKQLETAVI